MKIVFKLFALVVLISSTAGILFAQQIDDVSKTFDEIHRKSFQLKEGRSYRLKTTSETYPDKNSTPNLKQVWVYEVAPPDRSYYSSTYETDSLTITTEGIQIGEKRFVKRDGGKWEIDDSELRLGVGGEGRESVKFIEKTIFNNQTANVYEVKSSRVTSSGSDSKNTTKYWFSELGLLLKSESEDVFGDGRVVRRISTYDYDANIKIDAPILSKETK